MRDKHQKKLQKRINKAIKAMNQNIYNDNLWMGRFYAHQVRADYTKFEDGSGGILSAWLELVDRKTNQTKLVRIDNFGECIFLDWDIWKEMNDFITEDCAVWRNKDDDPYKNRIDFRKETKRC